MKEKYYQIIKTFSILELAVFTNSYLISFFLLTILGESLIEKLFISFFVSAQVMLIICIPLLTLSIFIEKYPGKLINFITNPFS